MELLAAADLVNLEIASDPAITDWTDLAILASIVCPKADV